MSEYFLQKVLPDAGRYCAVSIHSGRVKQRFFTTIQEVAEAATAIDELGHDAYFALATFTSNSRKVDDAEALRCFFVDLDCGPNKPYPAAHDAAQALAAFVAAAYLPAPIVVHSGGGLHAYWPFTEAVPVGQWAPAARSFKALCVQHRLAIDLSVTADAARILRVPGTSNHKTDTPRPVRMFADGEQTPFADLCALLPAPAADLSAARAFGTDETTKALARGDWAPSTFTRILPKCAQMRHAVENSATLEEPLWRAALSIAIACEDAPTAIMMVSQDHPDFDPQVTQDKAAKVAGKPYTCDWYKANAGAGCAGCTHRVSSPITLGEAKVETPVVDGAYIIEAELNPDSDEERVVVTIAVPEYPHPYFRPGTGGVYRREEQADDGTYEETLVYPLDLYITGRFYDSDEHGDGEGELVGLNLHLPHDGIRRFHAPITSLLVKDKLLAVLVKHGVIAYGKTLDAIMAYLATSIRSLQASTSSNRTRNQMGWTSENSFVIGELEHTLAGPKLAPSASGLRQLAPTFHSKGDIEEWRKIIAFYNRPGMEAHAFAFLVGCGAPLLQLLNPTQVRGGMLNLVSNGSGTGKTTVQMAVNSIFGHPTELLMAQKDTKASMFQRMGTLNSICMTVDELTNMPADALSDLVYGATSGRAAHRMESATNKLRSNQTTWCTVVMSSSNAVLSDILASNKSAADGELRRVIDLPISVPDGYTKAEAEAVFAPLADNYGLAGHLYIPYLLANRESIIPMLKSAQIAVDNLLEAERADRFYSAIATVGFGAGIILNSLGLVSFDLPRIFRAALSEVRTAKVTNSIATGTPKTLAHETLAAFINDNLNNTLIINGTRVAGVPAAPIRMPHGPLRMRYEPDTGDLVVVAADLRRYFTDRRVDFKASIHAFRAQGALRTIGDEPSVVRRPAAGALGALAGSSTRCYVFDGAALGMKDTLDATV